MLCPDEEKDSKFCLGSEDFTSDRPPQHLNRRGFFDANQTVASDDAVAVSPLDDTNGDGDAVPQPPRQRANSEDATQHDNTPDDISSRNSAKTSPSRLKSVVYQRLLHTRRQRQRKQSSSPPSQQQPPLMSPSHSTLPLSRKLQHLFRMTAQVVNCDSLPAACRLYHDGMDAIGRTIQHLQRSWQQQQPGKSDDEQQQQYHRDLTVLGILIGLLRTKLALLSAVEDDDAAAVAFCQGAIQVHQHQPTLRNTTTTATSITPSNNDDQQHEPPWDGCLQIIVERLERARSALQQHAELLNKIDLHTTAAASSCEDGMSLDGASEADGDDQSSTKEIVLEMIWHSAEQQGDESTIGLLQTHDDDDDILDLLSVHASEQDKHEQGMRFLRDALQIHLVALGLKHPTVGKRLLRIANMYRGGNANNRSNENQVLGYFHQTASVLKRSHLGSHERGAVLNDIAVIHMRRGEYGEAIKFLLDALHTYDEDEAELERAGRTAAALQVWRNLGECYMQLRKFRSAEGAYLKAMDIQEQARKIQDAAESLELGVVGIDESLLKLISDTSIAATICKIGKARSQGGDHKKALDLYKKAMGLLYRSSYENDYLSEGELLAKRDQLTQIFSMMAEACASVGIPEKGFAMYRLSMKLRSANGAQEQDRRSSTLEHNLVCFLGIGDLYTKTNELDNAVKTFGDALNYAESNQIPRDSPLVSEIELRLEAATKAWELAPDRRSDVSKLERRADEEIENGQLDKATGTLKELLSIRKTTLKNMKSSGLDTSEQIYSLGCLLQTFGYVFAKNGDDENAEVAFKDASRLFRKGGIVENDAKDNLLSI